MIGLAAGLPADTGPCAAIAVAAPTIVSAMTHPIAMSASLVDVL
jgi:hypothetical protein